MEPEIVMWWVGGACLLGCFVGYTMGLARGFYVGCRACEDKLNTIDHFMGGQLRDVLKRAEDKIARQKKTS